jgi:cysteine desulfurase
MQRYYFDVNATMPTEASHLADLLKEHTQVQGNPSSQHYFGREAKIAMEEARDQVARVLGADNSEVVFCSGATEANNLVIFGVVLQNKGSRAVVTSGEHSSVLEPLAVCVERSWSQLTTLPLAGSGRVENVRLSAEAHLACFIHGNNEVGTVNDVLALARDVKAQSPQCHVHVDAVQTFGKLDLAPLVKSGQVDSLSFSGHKIGALKGVGGLFLRRGCKLARHVAGGGQERARRPGTENLLGILSLGLRMQSLQRGEINWDHARLVRDKMLSALRETVNGFVLHGSPDLPNTFNFHIEDVAGDDILLNLDLAGIAASSGSACSSGVGRPSHVLLAMGYSDWVARNSVRVSLPLDTPPEAIDLFVQTVQATVKRVRT